MAQQNLTEEEKEAKQMRAAIDAQIESLTKSLDLEDWQVFYADSIITNDYGAMNDELKSLRDSKVSNTDAYQNTMDKWYEQMYQSMHKVLNDDQWTKYQKSGAARAKKARDKRAAKRNR
jgi:hypothetical protein